MLLVVGLGNPGKEYASHRHNIGFMAVDVLASAVRADPFREKFSGLYVKAEIAGEPAILLKPMTFMNESGRSVQPAMAFFKIAPAELVVIHDELDLPFGTVRLKFGGGHAGHNGLRSLITHCGTADFGRVRVGIGRPPPGSPRGLAGNDDLRTRGPAGNEVADYVLSNFDPIERASLPDCLNQAAQSVLEVAARGFDAAMNVRNIRPRPVKKQPKGEGSAQASPPAAAGAAQAPLKAAAKGSGSPPPGVKEGDTPLPLPQKP